MAVTYPYNRGDAVPVSSLEKPSLTNFYLQVTWFYVTYYRKRTFPYLEFPPRCPGLLPARDLIFKNLTTLPPPKYFKENKFLTLFNFGDRGKGGIWSTEMDIFKITYLSNSNRKLALFSLLLLAQNGKKDRITLSTEQQKGSTWENWETIKSY